MTVARVAKIVIHRRILHVDGENIETQTLQVTNPSQIIDLVALLCWGVEEVAFFRWSPSVPNDHLILYDDNGVQLREVRVVDSRIQAENGRYQAPIAGYREFIGSLLKDVPVEGRPVMEGAK